MYYKYRSDTSVHTNFTDVPGVAWSTCAGEAVELVNTGSIVLTRIAVTLIQLWNITDELVQFSTTGLFLLSH